MPTRTSDTPAPQQPITTGYVLSREETPPTNQQRGYAREAEIKTPATGTRRFTNSPGIPRGLLPSSSPIAEEPIFDHFDFTDKNPNIANEADCAASTCTATILQRATLNCAEQQQKDAQSNNPNNPSTSDGCVVQ